MFLLCPKSLYAREGISITSPIIYVYLTFVLQSIKKVPRALQGNERTPPKEKDSQSKKDTLPPPTFPLNAYREKEE